MTDPKRPSSPMGDIIGSTRQRLEQASTPADRLKSLVAATAQPAVPPAPSRGAPAPALPGNYFPQVQAPDGTVRPKRKPQKGPTRSLHISMRLSPQERDRLVIWCEDRNLSLPDGIVALLDLAARAGDGEAELI